MHQLVYSVDPKSTPTHARMALKESICIKVNEVLSLSQSDLNATISLLTPNHEIYISEEFFHVVALYFSRKRTAIGDRNSIYDPIS